MGGKTIAVWRRAGIPEETVLHWITRQIAIGNFLDARSPNGDINAILCLKKGCCDEANEQFDVLCVPLIDGPGNKPSDVADCIDYIRSVLDDGENILVHCHAGRSRSVVIVARFMMMHFGLTRSEAIERIRGKREIYITPGIEEILDFRLP